MYFQNLVQNVFIINMILLILTILIFTGLIVLNFVNTPKKLLLLCVTVCVLIICNFINELLAFQQSKFADIPVPLERDKNAIQILEAYNWQSLKNRTYQSISNQLIEQQKQLTSYLLKIWEEKQYSMLHFENLHKHRLNLIIDFLKLKIQNTTKEDKRSINLFKIDYKTQDCDLNCYYKTLYKKENKNNFHILIVQNAEKSAELSLLQQIYLSYNLSIIFRQLSPSFWFHSISKLVHTVKFTNNYLVKFLQNQPSKVITQCASYHNFDYYFYLASKTGSLNQICSRPLPSNAATRCLQTFIKEEKEGVPLSWVRNCLSQGSRQGFYEDNGWIYLDKQYFWSGRVNRSEQFFNQTLQL